MNTHTIILGVVLIVLAYFLYNYFFSSSSSTLVHYQDATQEQTISASSLPSNNGADYTYSIWFYINDWNYKYGSEKVIFQRTDGNNVFTPQVSLDKTTNNLHVSLATYPVNTGNFVTEMQSLTKAEQQNVAKSGLSAMAADDKSHTQINLPQIAASAMGQYETKMNVCSIEGVPLQTWTNLIISLNTRALDLYLDGKLVRTCVLPGVPKINPSSNIKICPAGGFSGFISNFQYQSNAVNPTQAYNIYKQGYGGGSAMGSFFNKYRVKIAFVEDNKEVNSFEL